MRVLVFGSRNLTARHVAAMIAEMKAVADGCPEGGRLVLVHGAGPRGTTPGAIGADMLSEVAAQFAWVGRARGVRRFPVEPKNGETWGAAAIRRDGEMVALKPERALCFHTDPGLGKGSAATARMLTAAGLHYVFIHLTVDGQVLNREGR